MIHWYDEGAKLKQGLNIYRPKDEHSIGCLLVIGNRGVRMRYSKLRKKWFFSYDKVSSKAYEKFMSGDK